MEFSKIGFIGLGLIGGSIAKTIKRIYPDTEMIATAGHRSTVAEAYADHTIKNDDLLPVSDFSDCDLIFLCCPVKQNLIYLKQLKSVIKKGCIITDVEVSRATFTVQSVNLIWKTFLSADIP